LENEQVTHLPQDPVDLSDYVLSSPTGLTRPTFGGYNRLIVGAEKRPVVREDGRALTESELLVIDLETDEGHPRLGSVVMQEARVTTS
jgi:hypothetical protein